MINTDLPILICGAGNSIPFLNSRYRNNGFKNGLEPKLQRIIEKNYSIGLNFFEKYGCNTTFTSFVDWQFYIDQGKWLKKLPLIIGKLDPSLKNHNRDKSYENSILLKASGKYFGIDAWTKGFYTHQLVGLFALNIAVALGFKNIYLLGFDSKEINGQTHFYQGVVNLNASTPVYLRGVKKTDRYHFRGVGKRSNGDYNTSTYDNPNLLNKKWFRPFYDDKDIKIYNVSPESAITLFEKIDYNEFYNHFENYEMLDQIQARDDIRNFINKKIE